MSLMNKQIHLASRPKGEPTSANFRLVESPVPELADGQVLVRNHYLSLDPYMRPRMDGIKTYIDPQPLDAVMGGASVGEVVASRHADYKPGDRALCWSGWELYTVADPRVPGALSKVDDTHVPLSAFVGAVGMPGVTAWAGIEKIIKPKAGETVLVSAASGAVGAVVGQLLKARGVRAVGLAGGPDKCRYVTDELGFDACVDYKQHRDLASLTAALKQACPNGIDGVFENVGGVCMDAAMKCMNPFGRIAVCGMIAGYNGESIPMAAPLAILTQRLLIQGFIVSEFPDVWAPALTELATLVASGKLKYRESIAQGIENAPQAFIGMLRGQNFGKQLVKVI